MFRDELKNLDIGIHHVRIYEDKLCIQETFFNRICFYDFTGSSPDPETRFVPDIYEKGVNANIKCWPHIQAVNGREIHEIESTEDLSVENYRHINSLDFCGEYPNIIFCTTNIIIGAVNPYRVTRPVDQ